MAINHYHLTAKERDKMSFPTNWLLRNHLIKGKVLDFGSGHGIDVKELKKRKFNALAYDPYYQPQFPDEKFDTILCHYVINVLEKEHELRIIMRISKLLAENGVAYICVRRDLVKEGYRTHKVHKKTTYQRNVNLPFKSIYKNDFCEIYSLQRFVDRESDASCIFCKPTKKSNYIAESPNLYCIYDAYPVNKGHVLIIPKKHQSDYFKLELNVQKEICEVTNLIKKYLDKKFHPDGYNVGVNIGEVAGQSIFHVHVHVIPRYKGDTPNPKGGVRHVIPDKGSY